MWPPRAGGSGRAISLSGDVIWPQSTHCVYHSNKLTVTLFAGEWIARLDEWLSRWPAHKYINWHLQVSFEI
jgi:hypothetical protein